MGHLIWRLVCEYGAGFALSALGWATGFCVLGLLASLLFYHFASGRGYLDCGFSFDKHVRFVFLILWIGVGTVTFGSAGGLLGIERSLIHLMKEEKIISKASQEAAVVIAPTLCDVLVEQLGVTPGTMENGQLRIAMIDVRSLETKADELLIAARKKLEGQEPGRKGGFTTASLLRRVLVHSSFKAAASLGGRKQALLIKAFINKLETRQDPEGKVGVDDIAIVMSDHFLEAFAVKTLKSSFFWSELGSCAITLLVWLLTLFLCWVIRFFTTKPEQMAEQKAEVMNA